MNVDGGRLGEPVPAVWPALAAGRSHFAQQRVPFTIGGVLAGSVQRAHLQALRALGPELFVTERAVEMSSPQGQRNAVLAGINNALRDQGLIKGWREECFDVPALPSAESPASAKEAPLAIIERAAARFWGTLTLGAHATGFVRGKDGRPSHLWLAQRSPNKATDPGLWDNLIGGGVPHGQSPFETLVREGFEEAGLPAGLVGSATAGSVVALLRDVPHGLQREHLHAFDLELPPGLTPQNQDGEVQGFSCLPVQQALALAASDAMTVDASLVTLDFALRHRLCAAPPGAEHFFGAAA